MDLTDRSNQPFYDKNTDCYLAINGEIINYKELAKKYSIDLESAGSDCKLVFQLFNRYGVRKLLMKWKECFLGFTLIKKNISIIFRDRFGIKPIYYYITNDYFVAASEINAILPFIDKPSQEINIVRDFIIDGNIDHSNKTFFANIFQLSSGNLMEIDNFRNKISTIKWYEEIFEIEPSKFNYKEAKEELTLVLKKLVSQNYISDVPVAINLSEGIDSTLLAIISESIGMNPSSYSLKFGLENLNKYYNLQPLNLNRKYIDFNTELFLMHLKDVIRTQGQPFTGMFTVAFSHFYETSRNNGHKVHLDGNGLDEIFLGYDKYFDISNINKGQVYQEKLIKIIVFIKNHSLLYHHPLL